MLDPFQPAPQPASELGRFRILSPTAGIRVSPLQLGAMSIGEAWSSFMGSMNKEQSFELLDAYFEAGGNFIDTSNDYQNEQSEAWIGEWMKARGNRDLIVVSTKYTMAFRAHEVGKGKSVNYCGNHKKSLYLSVRASLEKLQTDYIDVLYLHWWDYSTSIEEIMDSLHMLVEQQKVLYLGISDTPAWVVATANTYARDHGKTQFSIYQGRWNILIRDLERDIVPMCLHFGMAIAPWDVLGGGKFQSRKMLEARSQSGEPLRPMHGTFQTTDQIEISEALSKVASEHGIESVTAIALAWVLSKAPNVFPIIGGRRIEHLRDNIGALSIKLTSEQIKYLESIKPMYLGFPHDFIGEDPKVTGKSTGFTAGVAPIAWVQSAKSIGHV